MAQRTTTSGPTGMPLLRNALSATGLRSDQKFARRIAAEYKQAPRTGCWCHVTWSD